MIRLNSCQSSIDSEITTQNNRTSGKVKSTFSFSWKTSTSGVIIIDFQCLPTHFNGDRRKNFTIVQNTDIEREGVGKHVSTLKMVQNANSSKKKVV